MSLFNPDNAQLVLDMGKLSKLAYASEAEILATWKDVCPRLIERPVYFSSIKDAQALGCIYRFENNVNIFIIAYRGTSSFTDARADINIAQVPVTSKVCTLAIDQSIKVHRGFFTQYASLEKETISYMTKVLREKDFLGINHILFVGHSLGAGTSSIAASIPKLLPVFETFKVGLITFGCPRVGLTTFADFLQKNTDWTLQIKNNKDPVVSILPKIYGYTHLSPHFRQIGKPDPYPDSCSFFDIGDHYIESYLRALQQDPLGDNVPPLSWTDYLKGSLINKPLAYLQSWAW